MRKSVKEFAGLVRDSLEITEPIYEFGSLRVSGQETFADLRPLFPDKEYIGADMRKGLGVDTVLNLHDIDLPAESVGTVLCFDTLEHVEFPHTAMEQIYGILKRGGIVVISSVMNFRIHDYPCDYWRFSPEAFKSMLKPFTSSWVGHAGLENFPHTVVGIGFKGELPSLSGFEERYKRWQHQHFRQNHMSVFKRIRKLITPPLLCKSSRRALGL